MTTINPYDGLISFQETVNAKLIKPKLIDKDKNYYLEVDEPLGILRITYALIVPNQIYSEFVNEVRAICQVVPVEEYKDKPTFQIGCAVLKEYQNKGIAKQFVSDCLKIFSENFIARNKLEGGLYFEAIIDKENSYSQKLFEYLEFIKVSEILPEGDWQYFKFIS